MIWWLLPIHRIGGWKAGNKEKEMGWMRGARVLQKTACRGTRLPLKHSWVRLAGNLCSSCNSTEITTQSWQCRAVRPGWCLDLVYQWGSWMTWLALLWSHERDAEGAAGIAWWPANMLLWLLVSLVSPGQTSWVWFCGVGISKSFLSLILLKVLIVNLNSRFLSLDGRT